MRYILMIVVLSLALISQTHAVAGPEALSTRGASEVLYGDFSCQAAVAGPVVGRLSVYLSFQGTLFASPNGLVLSNETYPDDAAQDCTEIISEIKSKAEAVGCTVAHREYGASSNFEINGLVMVCAGSRSSTVGAAEAIGRKLVSVLSSLE
jgi:hypothetical protein